MSGAAGFHIRLLSAEDAAALRRLRLQALQEHPDFFGADYEDEARLSEADFAARMPQPPGGIFGGFAASSEDLAASVTLVVPAGRKQRHRGHVYGLYVEPSWRNQGLGRALMEALIRHAREQPGLRVLLLAVTTPNAGARRLYLGLDFQAYGVEPRALQVGQRLIDEELLSMELG